MGERVECGAKGGSGVGTSPIVHEHICEMEPGHHGRHWCDFEGCDTSWGSRAPSVPGDPEAR